MSSRPRPDPGLAPGSVRHPGVDPTVDPAALPESFIEVRVGAGRVEILEFHSRGQSARLSRLLRRLGLEVVQEVESPCG
ncbi:MAG: hypothetical protein AB1645_08990 [Bacillota bacterium]